jgi:hypothetical protein
MICPPDNPSPADLDDEAERNAPELAGLRADFPCFRIWHEETCDRAVYMSRSLHLEINPHTVMTGNIAELRAALESASHLTCPRPHPPGQPLPARTLQATAS